MKWKDLALGFVRLSVIDLSENAMQPMLSQDGRYAIVFNGEIYDYKKNRRVLEEKGYHFKTQSDTEVLLYAFIEWREKMVDYFDGIFAFAVYDTVLHGTHGIPAVLGPLARHRPRQQQVHQAAGAGVRLYRL